MTYNPQNTVGPFLQTSLYFPEEFEEFRVKFLEVFKDISSTTNIREIGVYDRLEFLAGQQWFNATNSQQKRSAFRRVYSFGNIATGATLNIPHLLTNFTEFTHIRGTCITDVVDYRPIPYSSVTAANQQIEINVTATNIVIINGAAAPNITSGTVVLEFLKS